MAEQADALGSNPGSSKEYEFDSHQGDYHNERRDNMDLRSSSSPAATALSWGAG